ncbi:MAG: fructosamine kinase family protein [Proteobacteria bacterium]|nr:fructosamine kinase family protein [Pseudomonadota bacterium]
MITSILAELGHDPARCRTTPLHGGDIHAAWRVDPPEGAPFFVKANASPRPRFFELEADGLAALAAAASPTLAVPEVLGWSDRHLALAWIPQGRGPDPSPRLGAGLAQLHRTTDATFGWPKDNWIGSLPQSNQRHADLAAFFGQERLRFQAQHQGKGLQARIDRLCERLPDLLPDEPPALLHGDLWGGNWTSDASGTPWIYDPAVHYGCREAELAFTRLFGGFPGSFYDAYNEAWPLEPGFDERVDLWNLYPLLVHANLFGGGYAGRVDAITRRFGG